MDHTKVDFTFEIPGWTRQKDKPFFRYQRTTEFQNEGKTSVKCWSVEKTANAIPAPEYLFRIIMGIVVLWKSPLMIRSFMNRLK